VELDLGFNELSDRGGRLFLKPTDWPNLRRLTLDGSRLSSGLDKALRQRWGPRLELQDHNIPF
jgi:hypothetical protein